MSELIEQVITDTEYHTVSPIRSGCRGIGRAQSPRCTEPHSADAGNTSKRCRGMLAGMPGAGGEGVADQSSFASLFFAGVEQISGLVDEKKWAHSILFCGSIWSGSKKASTVRVHDDRDARSFGSAPEAFRIFDVPSAAGRGDADRACGGGLSGGDADGQR